MNYFSTHTHTHKTHTTGRVSYPFSPVWLSFKLRWSLEVIKTTIGAVTICLGGWKGCRNRCCVNDRRVVVDVLQYVMNEFRRISSPSSGPRGRIYCSCRWADGAANTCKILDNSAIIELFCILFCFVRPRVLLISLDTKRITIKKKKKLVLIKNDNITR